MFAGIVVLSAIIIRARVFDACLCDLSLPLDV